MHDEAQTVLSGDFLCPKCKTIRNVLRIIFTNPLTKVKLRRQKNFPHTTRSIPAKSAMVSICADGTALLSIAMTACA